MKNKKYLKESDHSKEKKELLALLLEEEGLNLDEPPVITPRKGGEAAPLSFAQERLLFLYHLFPEIPAYNVSITMRLAGIMDISALQKSLQALIDRHESLRTCFPMIDDQPAQVIRDDYPVPLLEHSLMDLPEAERETAANKVIEEEILRPFDITRGPVIRAALLRIADQNHILLITLHHIVTDGWSRGIIQRDLAALYNAQVLQQTPTLPELPIQYVDFAHWQRQWLTGEVLEDKLRYWRKRLAEVPTLRLPMDRPRPPVQTHSGASYTFQLSKSLTQDLRALSRQSEVTLATTLLAAFQALLGRYTGQTDIAVGMPIANRTRPELENLVGFFVNSLVMRTDLSGDPTFRELLGRVHSMALGAYEHQDLPFEQLVAELQPERDFSRNPLFQVLFAFQNVPREVATFHGLAIRPMAKNITVTRLDLECFVGEGNEELHVALVYNTDLFDPETIEGFGTHFQKVLTEVVRDPEQRISDMQILTDTERQQLLFDWNNTTSKYPRDRCVHEQFEQQVEQSPDAVAIVCEDEQLTYRQLNTRANQLAHYLKGLGVGPEVLVGICLERCLEMIIAVLGVLKAGGGYVPMDPVYPSERLRFMLQDTNARVVVTHTALQPRLLQSSTTVLCLDRYEWRIAQEPSANPSSCVTAENLAYVIFTSGSTGTPKGVALCHRTLTNLVVWQAKTRKTPGDCTTLQFASLSFDVSCQEIFSTLGDGGRLLLIPESIREDLRFLLDVLYREGVERIFLPVVALQQITNMAKEDGRMLAALREVITAGEQLKISEAIVHFMCHHADAILVNQYGPSESHVVTSYELGKSPEDWSALPAIGLPIDNTDLYVLDVHLEPVPVGVYGELYIGGDGLARNYLQRPALTAEKFVPHPFSEHPGARLYRTGDWVRYLQDGRIEFWGRIDHQVKIRGFRIELGEIESVLGRHPAVEEAVVIAREDVPGDKRLVAYVVASHEPTPTFSELRSFLKEKLPDYMIPSVFMSMDAMPLTANGKVDRRALPAPDVVRPDLQEAFAAPRSQSEELVAGIWSNVLGLERIGVYDSFFELGGHSLLVVQIISRIREVFEVELALRALFEAPTVAGLTERIETARRSNEGLQTCPLQAVSRDQDLPLSFAQERLWFLHHLEPDSVAYSMPRSIRLKGVLKKGALEKTYVELARRHETLRSTIHTTDGNPLLRIAAEPNILFDTVDLRHLPGVEREAEAKRLREEDARKPFDLRRGPLFRIRLFQLEDEEHVLHFNMHHIISDGWSFGVMAREIAALYTAFIKGKPADLPELPVQYADYALWQRQWLQGEALEAQLNYWKDKLGGELPVLELPTDRPRPAVQTHRGAIESLALSKELTDALQVISRREGVTLFMTLFAAFKTLLYRLTGQEDTIVGTPIAGRNRTELEGLIGFFMNTIVMRTDLSGNPTFRELLGRVRETALGAYSHQDMPFERLVEELAPERDLSRTPLFQVFFNHIVTMGDKAAGLPEIESEAIGRLDRESKFDLTLYVLEGEGGIGLHLVYNTDLFDSWRMAQMLKQYQMLLESIVSDSDQRICELSLLTEAERQQILVDWNDTAADYPEDKCMHTLFETQAEHSPEAVAVIFEDEQLSYGELNCRANQLAHYLRKHGVGSEQVVGICMERSLEMIIGLLAILKAGGAYVALESDFPGARLSFMLEDTKPGLLLTQQRLLEKIPEYSREVVCLDRDGKLFENEQESNLEPITTPEDLAYVTYTSGSTGKPKGILTRHRSVVQNLHALIHNYSLSATDIVLQLTSFSFDASVRDMFGPLLAGARIVVVRNDEAKDPSALVAKIAENHVTCILSIVPSQLTQLVEAGSHERFSIAALRHISAAGEPLPMDLCKRVQDVFGCSVVNQYGPTECTMISSYHRVVDLDGNRNIALIGRPIANTQFYILDDHLNPVPIGVAGEAYIGGLGVSKGYLNLPDLTADKFIPNPFSNEPEDRLYKTGDMVRFLPDGTMEFLDRRDFQVKLRGVRIELGEVEATLSLHPSVSEAVVVAREDRPGDKRLVAYVVAAAAESVPSTGVLRAFLQERLPDYMIPTAFVYLDCLPITPNGKVDRRALPAPYVVRPDLQEAFAAPRSQSEELVAGIWSNVLGLERIGVYDSFFDLGGHSLLVVQIVSRIRGVFEVELPVRALFEAPTVAGLTEFIEAARRSDEGLQTSPLQAVSRDQELPLSFAQERLWFLHHLEPDSVAYSLPRSIRLKGVLRKDALQKTYVELARRHETLRTAFHSTDGHPVLRIAADPDIVLDTVDLRHLPEVEREAEVKRLCEEDARKPFDLKQSPLFRIRLYQLEDEAHVLHFNMHHIISDFWSFGVMAREIATLYTAFIKDKPADLPKLPVQYADYAVWQRQWLQGEALDSQLNYWKDKLGGELPVLELPTDRPRPAVQTHRGAIKSLALSKELTDALQVMSRREGVTLFMTLLAAFKTLLYRLTGQADTIVGTPIAGRNRTELEGLIGFFMNTIVMRTDLSGQPTFRELLGRVRETALGAYTHQDMPFERLVEELSPERDLSRTPLFQVFFNHIVAMGDKAAKLPGLEAEAVGGLDRESKFDMTLYVLESEGGIGLRFLYNTDLFDSWRMAEMLKQYEVLLKQIVENSDEGILHYSLVTAEAHKVLPDPSALLTEPLQTSIIEMFANWVKRTPEQPALSKGDQTLTYEKLFKRTQILARILRLNGLDRGDVVAVYGPRSFGFIANMMAVFLSGGVLLPIDDSLPRQRQQLIFQESGAKFLLYIRGRGFEDAWWEQDPALGVQSLEVDTKGFVRADTDFDLDAVSLPELGIDDAAYIFFTSGTTGVPKGVLGSHKGLNHFLNWQRETFDITPDDKVAHLTSFSFDPVLREIFLPLTSGATLCLPEDIDILAANDVLSWLDRERISVLHTVPSLAQSWLTNATVEVSLSTMRWVFFAGESLTEHLVDRWQSTFPSAEIVNLYGPAETTLAKCFYQLSSGVHYGVQPLGRPLPQTQALVLSRDNQLCSIGEAGEIVLRTPFRSLGYINNHEENQKRFVKNPFRDDEKDQLYYTGDRGRYRPDGMLEFLGRLDDQVKIRGVRVEPNEVTVTLARHPAVDSCFVTSKRDEQGQTRLVGYVVLKEQSKTIISELRAYLSQELPVYMIPSAFVFLDALPLTTRGKVDRRALPVPDERRPDIEASFAAPRNAVEEALAEIWGEILRIEKVGIQDNFFDLGGHSLMATQIISRLCDVFQVEIPLRQLFLCPTIAELALTVAGKLEKAEQENVEQLLDEFEDLSDEEAERLLAQELGQNEKAIKPEYP